MRRLRAPLISLVCLLAMMVCAGAAGRLEDVAEGEFKASGTVRQQPGRPIERLFCRMKGRKVSGGEIEITGRCANATNSAPIKLRIEVVEAGTRYRMISRDFGKTFGPRYELKFTGARRGSKVVFIAKATIADVRHESRFVVALGANGIDRIVETVTRLDNREKTTLFDIRVRRQ